MQAAIQLGVVLSLIDEKRIVTHKAVIELPVGWRERHSLLQPSLADSCRLLPAPLLQTNRETLTADVDIGCLSASA